LSWLGLLAIVAIAAWLGWRRYEQQWLMAPIAALSAPVTYEVKQGVPLVVVARELEAQGLMERPRTWLRHANASGLPGHRPIRCSRSSSPGTWSCTR
jgi:hypothetical protein